MTAPDKTSGSQPRAVPAADGRSTAARSSKRLSPPTFRRDSSKKGSDQPSVGRKSLTKTLIQKLDTLLRTGSSAASATDSASSLTDGHCKQPRPLPIEKLRHHRSRQAQQHLPPPGGRWSAEGSRDSPLANHPRYCRLRELNRGSSARVELAVDLRTGHRVAIKLVERNASFNAQAIGRELQNQSACANHPHVVQILDVFVLPQHVAIVMDLASGGDLAEYMAQYVAERGRGLPEVEARRLMQQLLVALLFTHSKGIANRDIKLDNILLHVDSDSNESRPSIKICDFGYSKNEYECSMSKTGCGTPEYCSPEVLTSAVYDGRKTDCWSAGCVFFVLLTGGFPFLMASEESADPQRKMRCMLPRIMAGQYLPLPNPVSPLCEDLLQRLLEPNPDRRLSLDAALAHPWMAVGMPPELAALNGILQERRTRIPSEAAVPSQRELQQLLAVVSQPPSSRCVSLPASYCGSAHGRPIDAADAAAAVARFSLGPAA